MTRDRSRRADETGESTPTEPSTDSSEPAGHRSGHDPVTDGGTSPETTGSSGQADAAAASADSATASFDESAVVDDAADAADDPSDEQVRYRTRPTIKPSLVWIGLTLLIGGTIAVALFQNVLGLEDPDLSSILGWVVVFVVGIVVARFLVRIYILTRTQYLVTDDAIRYEFTLWFRRRSRDVPFTQVRGHELDQNRVQRAFGVGTVAVLTGGTNASLGYVEFHNVPNPGRIRSIIRERTREIAAERR